VGQSGRHACDAAAGLRWSATSSPADGNGGRGQRACRTCRRKRDAQTYGCARGGRTSPGRSAAADGPGSPPPPSSDGSDGWDLNLLDWFLQVS
jgi:hypothetical protein